MIIATNTVVTFHYQLKDANGGMIETSEQGEPMAILVGHNNMLQGVEQAMLGKKMGDKFAVTLSPEQAYGSRRENAMQRVPIKHLHSKGKLKPGQTVVINTDHGGKPVTIIKVGKFNVDVDTNHPLAGKSIVFDIAVVDVREATPEEISHGHAHGLGGHHH